MDFFFLQQTQFDITKFRGGVAYYWCYMSHESEKKIIFFQTGTAHIDNNKEPIYIVVVEDSIFMGNEGRLMALTRLHQIVERKNPFMVG